MDHVNKGLFITIASVVASLGFFLLGPSALLDLPSTNLTLMRVGMVLIGVGKSFFQGYGPVFALEGAKKAFPAKEREAKAMVSVLQ